MRIRLERAAGLLVVALCGAMLMRGATFQVEGVEAKPWAGILGAIGISEDAQHAPSIVIAGASAPAALSETAASRILILQGTSAASEKFGIVAQPRTISVRQVCDVHAPKLPIIWAHAIETAEVSLPADFEIFARERWKGIPVLAGKKTARGAVLWMATDPGVSGIERYPYLLQALVSLGVTPAAETTNLWAFFDSAYRLRADSDYLAARWRAAGVSVLHVAAWHNMEDDAAQDQYLAELIRACHRHAILVYAWLELPHVSEKFWADHPAWREKTAVGQDAQLDWRKLMNLQNPACRSAVAGEVHHLLQRFDWDGVNVAELYFESLEGAANPARFTPFNDDVRADFKQLAGFDPAELFAPHSPYSASVNPGALRNFLDYRAGLAARMQRQWLDVIGEARASKPYLDTVLTHIDDRFEPGIRDSLGADVARSLPLLQARKSTLLVEDPATLWALGPERYAQLAEKYKALLPAGATAAVDINVVERYQDVYPTKKQTGVELFELLHQAATSFGRVALYFENSLEKQDLPLIPAAATAARVTANGVDELAISAPEMTRVAWQGAAEIDGRAWPVAGGGYVLVPGGEHKVRPAVEQPALIVRDFNGEIRTALSDGPGVQLSYASRSRAILLPASPVRRVEVDGVALASAVAANTGGEILLPAGQHVVSLTR